jgi:hypothetical protein
VSSQPTVSVLIVNYHSYEELTGCLDAVLSGPNQRDLEVLVTDQESDPTRLETIRKRFSRVVLLPSPRNSGFAGGVNQAAARATGRYLLLLNPDCVVGPDLIPTLVEWLEAHSETAVAGPRLFNADGSLQPSARRFPDLTTGLGGRLSWLTRVAPGNWLSRRNLEWSRSTGVIDVDWVSGACLMVRRSAYDAVGGMDERFFLYWEDADLCRRLLTAGHKTAYVPLVSAMHKGARASRHAAARSLVAFHRSAFRYYWKHGGLVARAFAPVVQAALLGRLALRLVTRKDDS